MKKNGGINKILLIELLILVGWCSTVLGFADYEKAGFYFWGGFSFGVLTFIITGISLAMIQIRNNRNTTEINYIPVYYTIIYFVLSLILNTYFVFRVTGKLNILLVALNSFLLVGFSIFRLYTNDYVSRVDEQSRHIVEKVQPVSAITSQLGTMIGMTTDPKIKKQLLALKEMVDYSSNGSQQFAQSQQEKFAQQLTQLQTMITQHEGPEEIQNKILEATATWKTRNNLVSTIK